MDNASDYRSTFVRLSFSEKPFYLTGCFQTGCFAPGYTVLLAPIKALSCFCFFPPMAEKSKPPALRLVGDSKKEELYECTGHLEEQKATKSAYELN